MIIQRLLWRIFRCIVIQLCDLKVGKDAMCWGGNLVDKHFWVQKILFCFVLFFKLDAQWSSHFQSMRRIWHGIMAWRWRQYTCQRVWAASAAEQHLADSPKGNSESQSAASRNCNFCCHLKWAKKQIFPVSQVRALLQILVEQRDSDKPSFELMLYRTLRE